MWVVKLGGSLLGTPELKDWLELLVSRSDGRIIIVPGGGAFADAVRDQQRKGEYDDKAAHQMALLAMEQYGLVLKSLQPTLAMASSELEIAECSWQHRAIVWMPSTMVKADETIPASWDVTSDSLAAWLARKIGADGLALIKHEAVEEQPLPIARLVDAQIVDPAFAHYAARLQCPIHIFGKTGCASFIQAFASGPEPALAF